MNVSNTSNIPPRIMVVDDERDILRIVKRDLEADDIAFKVDVFHSSELALQELDNHPKDYYDLILTDIRMPKMNGFELYTEIQKIDNQVKVCFITAGEMYYGVYTDIFNSLDAKYFIRKPIDNEELVKRVNNMISS